MSQQPFMAVLYEPEHEKTVSPTCLPVDVFGFQHADVEMKEPSEHGDNSGLLRQQNEEVSGEEVEQEEDVCEQEPARKRTLFQAGEVRDMVEESLEKPAAQSRKVSPLKTGKSTAKKSTKKSAKKQTPVKPTSRSQSPVKKAAASKPSTARKASVKKETV